MRKRKLIGPIILLPGTALVAVPCVLLYCFGLRVGWGWHGPAAVAVAVVGAVVIAAGLALAGWSAGLFAAVGEGTPAPWNPPRNLVVRGPYRHVRNPMISGALTVLVGEAVLFGSAAVAAWAAFFFLVNTVYFRFVEEPGLVRRFGEPYVRYTQNVPRWLPRRKPWSPPEAD